MNNKPDLIMSTSLLLYFYKINQGNYCEIVMSNTTVIYCGILTLEKAGNTVNYYGILITLDPGVKKYHHI